MIKRNKLIEEINSIMGEELLNQAKAKDEMANGVQILGNEDVEKVALGVSLNEEFLEEAVKWGADFCIFHHGLDTRTYKSLLPISYQKRLKLIFANNLTIMGLHYALDSHREIGNNAQIIKKLGAKIQDPIDEGWGYVAEFDKKRDLHELAHEAQELFDHEVFVAAGGPEKVKRVAVVSGGAKPYIEQLWEMRELGVDLFITGETSEWAPHKMIETSMNYFVCGHYATEVFGVKALGDKLKSKLKPKINIEFIDVKNEI